jgi:hypothetical protein
MSQGFSIRHHDGTMLIQFSLVGMEHEDPAGHDGSLTGFGRRLASRLPVERHTPDEMLALLDALDQPSRIEAAPIV